MGARQAKRRTLFLLGCAGSQFVDCLGLKWSAKRLENIYNQLNINIICKVINFFYQCFFTDMYLLRRFPKKLLLWNQLGKNLFQDKFLHIFKLAEMKVIHIFVHNNHFVDFANIKWSHALREFLLHFYIWHESFEIIFFKAKISIPLFDVQCVHIWWHFS